MSLERPDEPRPAEVPESPVPSVDTERLVRRTVIAGRWCVVCSALFLYLSKAVDSETALGNSMWAILLMAARMCGLGSFAIGGVAIYNGRWTEGVLLMLLSFILPVIAFVVHGTI